MDIITSDEINNGLEKQGRVYLCGKLEHISDFKHIPNEGYEIGISNYTDYTFEKAHIHTYNTEYNYVIEGSVKIFLLNQKKEYEFHAGDLFVIHANEPYVGKEKPGTRTIFSKVPGGNDKQLVPMSKALLDWGESWDTFYKEGNQ